MQKRRATRAGELVATACLLLMCCCLAPFGVAAQSPEVTGQANKLLQLAVTINGQATNVISQFSDLGGGRLAGARSELEELGVKVPGSGPPSESIRLDALKMLAYSYDERSQSVDLRLSDQHRLRKSYSPDDGGPPAKAQPSNTGAVLNYNLFAASRQNALGLSQPSFEGANASLDGRLLSPVGTVSQTAIAGTTLAQQSNLLRLQTQYSYDDDETLTSYRAGDGISGGLSWTRPIRFGGVQIQRSFSLRPDLVTTSVPTLTGSAAVPSTVDVYVNSIKAYSQQVGAGPFQLSNIPMMTGSGMARVVIRDAAGHETESSTPFYSAPRVLKEGVFDFSVETGLPRLNFGVSSDDYSEQLVGSGSLRLGITDWLTGEAHAEGGAGLINGGVGVVAKVAGIGVASAAVSGSNTSSNSGTQGYVSFDTRIDKISLHAQAQRTFGTYDDLASVTAQLKPTLQYLVGGIPVFAGPIGSIKPPRAINTISASLPTLIDASFINLAYLNLVPDDVGTKPSQLVSLSYTRNLPMNATMFATAYKDINDSHSAGLFVGVSIPLGKGVSASTTVARTKAGSTVSADLSKPLGQDVGSIGWSVHEGEGPQAYRFGAASYRASEARVEASVRQDAAGLRGTAEMEGALVVMGGKVFAANRIDDGFAVVTVGAPGVKVLRENNAVGETDEDGQLLVPNLNSYQRNKIAIDVNGLPLDTLVDATSQVVTPGLRGGIDVRFDVKKDVPSAVVVLHSIEGKDIPAGSAGRLDGSAEAFVVGYDGRAYIKGLKHSNTITVTVAGHDCKAVFQFKPVDGGQAMIGPLVCQ